MIGAQNRRIEEHKRFRLLAKRASSLHNLTNQE
jgi:hypothetical protein